MSKTSGILHLSETEPDLPENEPICFPFPPVLQLWMGIPFTIFSLERNTHEMPDLAVIDGIEVKKPYEKCPLGFFITALER